MRLTRRTRWPARVREYTYGDSAMVYQVAIVPICLADPLIVPEARAELRPSATR